MNGDDSKQHHTSLVRGLGLTDATMIVMGSMIGSGIFITSAESARLVGAPGWLLAAWALAGVMTISGALCCAELAAMMPRAGGQYVFLREAYGPLAGFLFGLGLGVSPKAAAWTSSWWDPWANGWDPQKVQPGLGLAGGAALALLLGRAMIGPLFSQSAWNNVTFTGGETRDPGRTLPRALLVGCGTVVGLYVLANVAYLVTLSFPEIQGAPQDRVGTALMQAVLGPS